MTPAERLRGSVRVRWRIIWPIVAVFIVVFGGWNSCTTYVRPGQWAVKQVVFGSGQGVHQEVYAPGTYFLTPGVERLHLFAADLQVLEMSDSDVPSAHIPNLRTVSALKIQTSEGYTVSVDVTVLYRTWDLGEVLSCFSST